MFTEFHKTLNIIFGAEESNEGLSIIKSLKDLFQRRLLSFLLVIISIVSIIVFIAGTSILSVHFDFQGMDFFSAIEMLISFLLFTIIFGLLFIVLPECKVKFRIAVLGAFITSFLFTVGKSLVTYYVSRSVISSYYGVADSAIALFLWVYYSYLIVLFGAELTSSFHKVIKTYKKADV
jgi:membrane protein